MQTVRRLRPEASRAPPAHLSMYGADFEPAAEARTPAEDLLSILPLDLMPTSNELLRKALQGQMPPAHQPRPVTASVAHAPSVGTGTKSTRIHKASDKWIDWLMESESVTDKEGKERSYYYCPLSPTKNSGKHEARVDCTSTSGNAYRHVRDNHTAIYARIIALVDQPEELRRYIEDLLNAPDAKRGRLESWLTSTTLCSSDAAAQALWIIWNLHHGISQNASDSPWLAESLQLAGGKRKFLQSRRSRAANTSILFNWVRHMITLELQNAAGTCFTYDAWTNGTSRFFVLTLHNMTRDYKRNSRVFDLVLFNQQHTASNIAAFIRKMLIEQLPAKIYVHCAVSDNAANMKAATTKVLDDDSFVGCFAHTLQLVINKVLEEPTTAEMMNDVKQLLTTIRTYGNLSRHLEQYQTDFGVKSPLTACIDNPTRWNSKYYMLQRFIALLPLLALMHQQELIKSPLFECNTAAHRKLQLANLVVKLLGKFEEVTIESQSSTSMMHHVPQYICDLRRHLREFLASELSEQARAIATSLQDGMEARFGFIFSTASYHLCAAVLQPSNCGSLRHLNVDDEVEEAVWMRLSTDLHLMKSKTYPNQLLIGLLQEVREKLRETASHHLSFSEFWTNSDEVSLVAPFAQMLSSVPATSAASEVAFSEAKPEHSSNLRI